MAPPKHSNARGGETTRTDLFTSFSLKQRAAEGLTPEQRETVTGGAA
jgi:hypothetical protein